MKVSKIKIKKFTTMKVTNEYVQLNYTKKEQKKERKRCKEKKEK